MAIFKKKTNFIGVDLGTSSIKIVELGVEGGKPQLVTYGFIEETADLIKSDSPEQKERIVRMLKDVMKKAEVTSDQIIAALPNFSVFSSIISLPAMSTKEMASAVRWEARKFVPMPIEDMVLDWKILEEPEKHEKDKKKEEEEKKEKKDKKEVKQITKEVMKPKTTNVLLTAAPKSLVQRYVDLFKLTQLNLISLETESFALTRALIGRDKSAVMVVDIGAVNTNIMVIVNNVPVINRSIDIGGETITQRIAKSLNIDTERAEQFKRDFGMTMGEGNDKVPKTIEFVIGSIVNELRYVVNLYQNQPLAASSVKGIEKIILTGGSVFLPNLPEYLENVMKLKVIIGDSWARVSYPIDLKPVLEENGPRLAVAIGLALRDIT